MPLRAHRSKDTKLFKSRHRLVKKKVKKKKKLDKTEKNEKVQSTEYIKGTETHLAITLDWDIHRYRFLTYFLIKVNIKV